MRALQISLQLCCTSIGASERSLGFAINSYRQSFFKAPPEKLVATCSPSFATGEVKNMVYEDVHVGWTSAPLIYPRIV